MLIRRVLCVTLLVLFVHAVDAQQAKLAKLDLAKSGELDNGKDLKGPWKMTVDAPAGATAMVIGIPGSHGKYGHGLLIRGDGDFSLTICAAKANTLAETKKDWEKDKATKKLVVDEAETLVREFTSPLDKKTVYQFIKYKKVGDREFTVEDRTLFGDPKARLDLEIKCADSLAAGK